MQYNECNVMNTMQWMQCNECKQYNECNVINTK